MEKKNIVDSLVGIIKETEEQDKMLQSQNVGWRKELRERFDWTQNTTIKGKVELEKFIQELLDKARAEGYESVIAELSISENMEKVERFFREAPIDYDDKCNLWNDFLSKLKQ